MYPPWRAARRAGRLDEPVTHSTVLQTATHRGSEPVPASMVADGVADLRTAWCTRRAPPPESASTPATADTTTSSRWRRVAPQPSTRRAADAISTWEGCAADARVAEQPAEASQTPRKTLDRVQLSDYSRPPPPASALRRLRSGERTGKQANWALDDRALCRSQPGERAARRPPRLQDQPRQTAAVQPAARLGALNYDTAAAACVRLAPPALR